MTAGVDVGFRDWDRTTHYAGVNKLVVNRVIKQGSAYTSPITYAGDYGYINWAYNTIGLSAYYFVEIQWYIDQSGSAQVVTQSFVTVPGGQGSIQFPVISPWFKVSIANYTNTTDGAFTLNGYASNARSTGLYTSQPYSPFIYVPSQSVAAGGSITTNATTIYVGPAIVFLLQNGNTAMQYQLQYWDISTTSWNAYSISKAASGYTFHDQVNILPVPNRLVIVNNGSASETMEASVVPAA